MKPELTVAATGVGGLVAGIDEAGRGPLAGPVVAAAVVLCPGLRIEGLDDSKRLGPKRRDALRDIIVERARGYGIGWAEVREIDDLNILQASLLAMRRALDRLVDSLGRPVDSALVDGNVCPSLPCPCEGVVKGDASIAEIAAASVLAKVSRDREMIELDAQYPLYGFARHKGYPTAEHLRCLRVHGVSPVHRRSFAPVRAMLS